MTIANHSGDATAASTTCDTVRPGRRATSPRRSRLSALAGVAAAALLVSLGGAPTAQARSAADRLGGPIPALLQFQPVPGQASDEVPAHAKPVDGVGVASFNVLHDLSQRRLLADAARLTSRRDVDLVGWQETEHSKGVFARLRSRGWETRFFDERGSSAGADAVEDAISWRASKFALVSSGRYLMHHGAANHVANPFPNRWVTRVTLRDRRSGYQLTLLNTHVNQRTESTSRPGTWNHTLNAAGARIHLAEMARMWRHVPGRYVLGTGDYNFSAVDDLRRKPAGGISRAFAGEAVSNWARLGVRNTMDTCPKVGKRIDYVFADARSLLHNWTRFESQRVLGGYASDHRPVVVRFSLR